MLSAALDISPALSDFDRICHAAKAQDSVAMDFVLSRVVVDLENMADETPVSKLAAEGKESEAAVDFLITKYNASRFWRANGDARCGREDKVYAILEQTENSADNLALLKLVIRGFIRSDRSEAAQKLLDTVKSPTQQFLLLKEIISAHGYCGQADKVKSLITKNSHPVDRFELLQFATLGFTFGGFLDLAIDNLLLAKNNSERITLTECIAMGFHQCKAKETDPVFLSKLHSKQFLPYLIKGYGFAGNELAANETLKEAESPIEQLTLFRALISGYALSGYIALANNILDRQNNPGDRVALFRLMIECLARSRHDAALNPILEQLSESDLLDGLIAATKGYASAGCGAQVRKLLQEYPLLRPSLLQIAVSTFAENGYVFEAENLAKESKNSSQKRLLIGELITGYMHGGLREEANRLVRELKYYPRQLLAKKIAEALQMLLQTSNPRNCTLSLALIPDPVTQENIAKEIDEAKGLPYRAVALLPAVKRINQVMTIHHLNVEQGQAWILPELQNWFLFCEVFMRRSKLTKELFHWVAAYLSPLTPSDSVDLFVKMNFVIAQNGLHSALKKYHESSATLCFFNRDEQAGKLLAVSRLARSKDELKNALQGEMKTLGDKGPYKELLDRHFNRLSR